MRDFSKRRSRAREFLYSLVAVVAALALAAIAIVALRAAWNMYEKFAQAGMAREATEGELEKLQNREVKVQTAITELSSERGVEAAVRERFGVVLPGEGVIHIVRDETLEKTPKEQGTFWQRLWKTFWPW